MFSLSATEGMVGDALNISRDDRGPLSATLKYFRRCGFPSAPKSGRGVSTSLNEAQVFELFVAVRLTQLGVPPKIAIEGATTASRAFREKTPRSLLRAFLVYTDMQFSVLTSERVLRIVEREESATILALGPLVSKFVKALPKPEDSADEFINVAEFIFKHRDGT